MRSAIQKYTTSGSKYNQLEIIIIKENEKEGGGARAREEHVEAATSRAPKERAIDASSSEAPASLPANRRVLSCRDGGEGASGEATPTTAPRLSPLLAHPHHSARYVRARTCYPAFQSRSGTRERRFVRVETWLRIAGRGR